MDYCFVSRFTLRCPYHDFKMILDSKTLRVRLIFSALEVLWRLMMDRRFAIFFGRPLNTQSQPNEARGRGMTAV